MSKANQNDYETGPRILAFLESMEPMDEDATAEDETFRRGREHIERLAGASVGENLPASS